MIDPVFGELMEEVFSPYGGWYGKQIIDFGGTSRPIELHIQQSDESCSITELQYRSYKHFMEEWPNIQQKLIDALRVCKMVAGDRNKGSLITSSNIRIYSYPLGLYYGRS